MNQVRTLASALIVAGMMALPANAATFKITLDQFSGPSGIGTFEANKPSQPNNNFGLVTSASVTLGSIVYTETSSLGYDPLAKQLFGLIFESNFKMALIFGSSDPTFYISDCYVIVDNDCSIAGRGSYTVEPVSAVPVPAALPLLASGLGALGFIGWRSRKNQKAVAAAA